MKLKRTWPLKPYEICRMLVFLTWFILLLFNPGVYAVNQRAAVTFSIKNISIEPDSQFSVPVNLSGASGVTAVRFSLLYDADILEPIDLESALGGRLLVDHTISVKKSSGKLTVLIYSSSLSPLSAGQGELIRLRFYVGEDAAPGTTALTFSELDASTKQGKSSITNSLIGQLTISGNSINPNLSEYIYFPQVANGSYNGGKYVTTVILVNQGSKKVNAKIIFRKSSGDLLPVTLTTQQSGSQISFSVPGNGSVFLQTDGAGPLEVGYAVVRSDFQLGGTLVFTSIADDKSVNAEAAVADSPRRTQSSIPVIFNRTQNTGIAIVNPAEGSTSVKIQLRNANGVAQAAQWLTFEPRQHLPRFVSEIFKNYDFKDSFEGSLLITSNVGVAAVALKLEGSLLTTFPVMEVQ